MNDDRHSRREPREVEPGEPVRELEDFAEEPPEEFTGRLMRRIDFKIFGTQLVDLGRDGFGSFFASYWNLIVSLLSGSSDGGKSSER